MITISLDASDVIETLAAMEADLKGFPNMMAQELTNWQTEDMRRRYPNTSVNGNVVETDVWPTSRTAEHKSSRQRVVANSLAKKSIGKPTIRLKGSVRPILRTELFDKLVDRMDKLMSEQLSWR